MAIIPPPDDVTGKRQKPFFAALQRHTVQLCRVLLLLMLAILSAGWPGSSLRAQETAGEAAPTALPLTIDVGELQLPTVTLFPELAYQRYDTELTLLENGEMEVRLTQLVSYDFVSKGGFFEIPRRNVSEIYDVQVFEAATAADVRAAEPALMLADFSVDESSESVDVEWSYPATTVGEERLFVISYKTRGIIWSYPRADFIQFDAINADRSGLPVIEGSVTVNLPFSIDQNVMSWYATGSGYSTALDGNTLRFDLTDDQSARLVDGIPFTVYVQWPHGQIPATVQEWQQAWDAYTLVVEVDRIDTQMEIQPNGDLRVTEKLAVDVRDGTLSSAYRFLKRLYLDSIEVESVRVNGQTLAAGKPPCENCWINSAEARRSWWVEYEPRIDTVVINEEYGIGSDQVEWFFAPVSEGDVVDFEVVYRVLGAVKVGDDSQVIVWDVVPDYGVAVSDVNFTLVPPPGVAADAITVESNELLEPAALAPAGTLAFSHRGLPQEDLRIPVYLTLPAGATTAAKPQWQADLEAALADQAAQKQVWAQQLVGVRTGGIFMMVMGILAAVLGWFRIGRRSLREQANGYTADPPSTMAPGLVAYLAEKQATSRSLLAAIFRLGEAGLLKIDLQHGLALTRLKEERAVSHKAVYGEEGTKIALASHESRLFNEVLTPALTLNTPAALESVNSVLGPKIPELYAAMAEDLQDHLVGAPSWEIHWRNVVIISVLLLVVGGGLLTFTDSGQQALANLWLTLSCGAGIFAILFWFFGIRSRSSLSAKGEAEKARWVLFGNYLRNLQEYGELGAAKEIFNRYFSYAVALGVAEDMLDDADRLGWEPPRWMPAPVPTLFNNRRFPDPARTVAGADGRPQQLPGGGLPTVAAGVPVAEPGRPSLAGMSGQLGSSLSGASAGMGSLFATAAGDGGSGASVSFKSLTQERKMSWEPTTPVSKVVDDIMRQSVSDARRHETRPSSSGGGFSNSWGSSSGGGSSRSSSRGGFGGSSRSSSRSSSPRRSSGGGRSGFR